MVSGDSLGLNYTSAAFSDANAVTGKTVTVSGISLSGNSTTVGDYTIANTATTTATINPVVLNLYGALSSVPAAQPFPPRTSAPPTSS